jgi:hypothetical protein
MWGAALIPKWSGPTIEREPSIHHRRWTNPPRELDRATIGGGTHPPLEVDPHTRSEVDQPTIGGGPIRQRRWTNSPPEVDRPTNGSGPAHQRRWTQPPTEVNPPTNGGEPTHQRKWPAHHGSGPAH